MVGGLEDFNQECQIFHFKFSYWFALRCFFGQAGCDYSPGLRGTIFIVMYALSYVGGGLLLRYAEGATYLAIVQVSVYSIYHISFINGMVYKLLLYMYHALMLSSSH